MRTNSFGRNSGRGLGQWMSFGDNWASRLESTSFASDVVVDSSGNSYSLSLVNGLPNKRVLFKLDPAGSVLWQRIFVFTADYEARFYDLILSDNDSLVTVVGSGRFGSLSSSAYYPVAFQFDSSGTFQWASRLGGTTYTDEPIDVTTASDGDLVVGSIAAVWKVTAAGATVWRSSPANADAVCTDSSGYIYAGGQRAATISGYTGTTYAASILSLDQYGAFNWGVQLYKYGSVTVGRVAGAANSGSYDYFLVGFDSGTAGFGGDDPVLVKYSSAGVLQWQKKIAVGGGVSAMALDVAVDSAGYVYALCGINAGTGRVAYILKFDSSGSLEWQNKITESGQVSLSSYELQVRGGYVYVAAHANGATVYRVPADGTGQGSGEKTTYAVSDATISTGGLSEESFTPTITTAYPTEDAVTLTYTTSTYDNTVWNF